jgi:hypothetical protein
MSELDDFDLSESREKKDDLLGEPELEAPQIVPEGRGSLGIVLSSTALVAALAAAVLLVFRGPRRVAPTPSPTTAPSVAPSATPTAAPLALPLLDESDALVRELARGLSSHPQLGAWLAPSGLVRIFTVSVHNLAEGRSAAPFVRFLTPREPFRVVQKGGALVADPRSYAAYDDLADGVASIDAAGVARAYRALLPLIETAYRELGFPDGGFTQTLERAVATLVDTPVADGAAKLRKGRVFYEYVDPDLEALSLAQKQLLRTGPRNVKLIQAKLRELARELGFGAGGGGAGPGQAPARPQ